MSENKHHLSLDEVLHQILQRDEEDRLISINNRKELIEKGLKPSEAKRRLSINTGEVVGIENVVEKIKSELFDSDKIIAIEGCSGAGKSSTTKALHAELSAISFSFGEVFRFLCYQENVRLDTNHQKSLTESRYQLIDNSLSLFHLDVDVSHHLSRHINDPEFSRLVPQTAAKNQDVVIEFMIKEIERINSEHNHKIILEGRDFTLDFLPCDLRVELWADAIIRAKRRLNQDFD